jgi:hypothetical protein
MGSDNINELTSKVERDTEMKEEAAASALANLGSDASMDDKDCDSDEEGFEIPQRFTKSGRKRAVPFPLKLMKVLSTKEFREIITWMPSGKSFSIVKPKSFVADILPDHFKSAKFSSFTRKLHRWGFMRHYRGEEAGAFYHKDFQRDRLDLVEKMTCHKAEPVKVTPVRKTVEKRIPVTATQSVAQTIVQRQSVQQPIPMVQNPEIVAKLQQQQQQLKLPEIRQPSLNAAERLNAAIELEVTRRLEERIQAAAVSRHALALMQQQINTPLQRPIQWNAAARLSGLQAQLLAMHQQKQQRNMDASCFSYGTFARMDTQGLDELPPTNIQGAKTA